MDEQPQEPEETSPFKEPKMRVVVQGSGYDEQIHVRVVPTKNQKRDWNEEFRVSLGIPRHQDVERESQNSQRTWPMKGTLYWVNIRAM